MECQVKIESTSLNPNGGRSIPLRANPPTTSQEEPFQENRTMLLTTQIRTTR